MQREGGKVDEEVGKSSYWSKLNLLLGVGLDDRPGRDGVRMGFSLVPRM
jgi:hypothetical protein